MNKIDAVVTALKQEGARLASELSRVRQAIKALRGQSRNGTAPIYHQPPRRRLSVEAGKKIARAQRARWAKWKAQQKKVA